MTTDKFPLLPRVGTMAAIAAARENLEAVEDTIGRELSGMAQELDWVRVALTNAQRKEAALIMEVAALREERNALARACSNMSEQIKEVIDRHGSMLAANDSVMLAYLKDAISAPGQP